MDIFPAEANDNRLNLQPEITIADGDAWMKRREARTLYETANRLIREQYYTTAVAMLRRSVALVPDDYAPWNELGVALHALGFFEDSVRALERALTLNPRYHNARSNLALVNGILGNWDEAEAVMRDLAKIPGRTVAEEVHLALMLLAKGDWGPGLELYERRVGIISEEFKLPKMPIPYWQGEDLDGKTLYIQTEQGIGDTIAFSRYIDWVSKTYPTAKLKLCCHQQYNNLLWEFRRLVDFVPAGVLWPDEKDNDAFDYGVYLHSIARHAGARLDNIYPDPGLISQRVRAQHEKAPVNIPKPIFPKARKIGIAWTGNPENRTQVRRSVPFGTMLYLATDPDNVLYSLQCGVGQPELEQIAAGCIVEDLSSVIESDLVICGAAMLELDVVVTCCTSIAHLAGAIGVPCFLLLCHDPYWLWGREPTSTPWYPSVRVFRQEDRGDWATVLAEVYLALREL